jgi:hypothetical protein
MGYLQVGVEFGGEAPGAPEFDPIGVEAHAQVRILSLLVLDVIRMKQITRKLRLIIE